MHPDNLNSTVDKPSDAQTGQQATQPQQGEVDLATLAADYRVRHPRFSAPAQVNTPQVDLTTEEIPVPEVPQSEQKLYLTETGSGDSTKKTWRDSSYNRLFVMGGIFGVGAVALGLMFNLKLPNVRTASVSMSEKKTTQEQKDPEFAGDGDYAAQAALAGQDGAYGTAKQASGHGYGSSKKPNSNPKKPLDSKTPVIRTTPAPAVRSSLPSTMAYNPTPVRRSYVPPTDDILAYRPTRRYAPAIAPTSVSQPSAPSVPAGPKQSPEERRLAAIAATSSSGGSTAKGDVLASEPDPIQTSQKGGYQEATYLASESAVLEGIPQQLISRSQKAKGRLLLGVAFTPGDTESLDGQPIEVEIKDPMQSGLPAGARIVATVDFPKAQGQMKSAVIRLTPTAIAMGDAEYPLPKGVVILSGENGKPLIAKRQGSEFLRSLNSTFKTVLSGSLGGLTSLAFGNGTGILSSLGGANALSGLTNLNKGTGTQQPTEILALRENTVIQINIVKPLSLPATQANADVAPEPVAVVPEQASGESVATSPESMMFTQDLTDAELMAIANHPSEPQLNPQSEQPQPEVAQPEVTDVR
jgi:hypothetical protein